MVAKQNEAELHKKKLFWKKYKKWQRLSLDPQVFHGNNFSTYDSETLFSKLKTMLKNIWQLCVKINLFIEYNQD